MEYVQFRINKGKLEYRYRLLDESTVLSAQTMFSEQWSDWAEVEKVN